MNELLRRIILSVLLLCLLSTCDIYPPPTAEFQNLKLIPLSPYTHEFSCQAVKCRNDYYFVAANRDGRDIKDTISNLVYAAKTKNASSYQAYSIYVYEQTDKINESLTAEMGNLRGVYDNALISYTRWSGGTINIFYYIESGDVVYDILENRIVSPSWEFD